MQFTQLTHIMNPIEEHNILTEVQDRFRRKSSCETQLLTTSNDLAEKLNKHPHRDVILLDFRKDFNKIHHRIQTQKPWSSFTRGAHEFPRRKAKGCC